MSFEILEKTQTFGPLKIPAIRQGVEHDMESFFWLFTWFAMSRDMSGKLREELSLGIRNDFVSCFLVLFSKHQAVYSTIRKLLLFNSPNEFYGRVIGPLLEWSRPFKPLLRDFYHLLRRTFKARDFENIHQQLLDMFTEAAQSLPREVDTDETFILQSKNRPSTPPQSLSTLPENSQPGTASQAFSESSGPVTSTIAPRCSTASPFSLPEAKRHKYQSFTGAGDESE
jgi:hypothetical protein